jgi:CheY-like chemotaxis protein
MGSQEMKYWPAAKGPGYSAPRPSTPPFEPPTDVVGAVSPPWQHMTQQNKRVLIVDDSPTALVWQLLLLQGEGYDTLTATDGAEGVRVALLERPDLILLDVTMPSMDGYTACRALRDAPETRDTPILMVTTNGDMGSTLAGFEAGCNEYITKPLDRVEYLTKVRSYLDRRFGGSA